MCQKPESRSASRDGEQGTAVSYKGSEEGRERVRSQPPKKAEDRLYKQLLPLKFCPKSYITTGSPTLIFSTIIQVKFTEHGPAAALKKNLTCQLLKQYVEV